MIQVKVASLTSVAVIRIVAARTFRNPRFSLTAGISVKNCRFLLTGTSEIPESCEKNSTMNAFKCLSGMSDSSTLLCPGLRSSWSFDENSIQEINTKTDQLIEKCRAVYDEIADLNFEQVDDKTIQILAYLECEFITQSSPLEFPQHVATSKELRSASTEASRKLEEFDVERSMRKDIFDRIVYWYERKKPHELKPTTKRYVERIIKIGKRNGLHLDHDTQFKIQNIKKRISDLSINFHRNVTEENTILEFTEAELDGLPEDFIKALEKTESGSCKVSLKYPHFFPIVRKCRNANTRLLIDKAYHSRCIAENTPIFEEVIQLRHELSQLLGYTNHSEFATELLMSKNPETVKDFLSDLKSKLDHLWKKEEKLMLDFKKKECEELGTEFDGKLNYWDIRYYMCMIEEKLHSVDQNKLKEYFPIQVVTAGLLQIYQELLGLKFEEVSNPSTWHPDVQMFKVEDVATEDLLGYFFLDLFPREGKYGHAGVFKLQPPCLDCDGKKQVCVAAMVTNFAKPTEDKPSLLDHKEVETYFHEFGHVMHNMCSKSEYVIFSGTRVERDFVEAPSQMLENWVWEPEPLCRMSSHYITKEPLPMEMIQKLIQSNKANAGIFNLRQIVLASFDQHVHQMAKVNSQEYFRELNKEITGIEAIPSTNMAASFLHLFGGYDSQYYGYLWSEVYSMDMFYSKFKEGGILNPEIGQLYRKCILEPGGNKDAIDMLRDFLGREPTQEAFLKSKGLSD